MAVDLDSLAVFLRVADLGSFTRAAAQLGLSKARVSVRLKALEDELGSPLLQRSTRLVRLTPEGEELLPHARRLVREADELASMFQATKAVRGKVRIDVPTTFARDVILPRLPDLLARHPRLEVFLSATDRLVEPLAEGFDMVLRVGNLADSGLACRRLGALRMMNCASPGYVRKHGAPQHPDDLDRHFVVHYSSALGSDPPSFEYADASGVHDRPMRSLVTVNSADAYLAAAVAGLGIIQAPRPRLLRAIADGELVEVLPACVHRPMPVSILHTHGRSAPQRVRAVVKWFADRMAPHLDALEREGAR